MPKLENPVLMAVIGAPHGIAGELRVKTFTADPLGLGDYGPLHDADGRTFKVKAIRPGRNVVVVRFEGIGDRNAAEALNGTELFVDRSALPQDLAEDEFYHSDLVGLAVKDHAGRVIGKVVGLHDFGGGDIIEVAAPGKGTFMVPFTEAAVPTIDLKAGILVIDPIAAGLTEDDEIPGGGRG